MTKTEKAASSSVASTDPRYLAMLSLGALGVVFGFWALMLTAMPAAPPAISGSRSAK